MPLIFITGTSTSGKSTIAKELSGQGYEAYDTEQDGMSAWYNKVTNERTAEFNEMPERTPAWLEQHEWRIDVKRISELKHKADRTNKMLIICGGSSNEPEVRALCDKVIWLKISEDVIRQRVFYPRDHDYGTRPHELADVIASNVRKEAEYRAYGATVIDASRSLDVTVSDIIEHL